MPLWVHMADSGDFAGWYWDHQLAASAKRVVIESLGGDAELARKVVVWLAAAHDAGKSAPAFAAQVPQLRDRLASVGLVTKVCKLERQQTPHSHASQALLEFWLADRHGFGRQAAVKFGSVVGGHHGRFLPKIGNSRTTLPAKPPQSDVTMGGDEWRKPQLELLDFVAAGAGITDAEFAQLGQHGFGQSGALIATAVVILTDWLASSTELCPLTEVRANDRMDEAVARLAMPGPWAPAADPDDRRLLSADFGLDKPRPVQLAALAAARNSAGPELMIIEAETGSGKTVAALAAATTLAERFGAGGVLFALPTRATSDAIFAVVHEWIRRTVDSAVTLTLAHGGAQFNDEFVGLPDAAGIYDDEEGDCDGAVANRWLNGHHKTTTVATMVVGTIDHVLLAALGSRHVVLRHLGLAGKVVILDEVHAADAYMEVFLDRAIEWLGAYRVPVIALSATLPPGRRNAMLTAYNKGRGRKATVDTPADYPLISATNENGAASTPIGGVTQRRELAVTELSGDVGSLVAAVSAASAEGGRIALVCNTVKRAQEVYTALRSSLPVNTRLELLHSRFLATERIERERELRESLGPAPASPRIASDRHIVVATQVIEQSLDLDFDLMFSDIAPIDLLIQRAGRIHRHQRPEQERPETLRAPAMVITGIERRPGEGPTFDSGSIAVYGEAALLRTVAVLDDHKTRSSVIRTPEDIAPLVAHAYDDGLVAPTGWETAWDGATRAAANTAAARKDTADRMLVLRPRERDSLRGWDDKLAAPDTENTRAQVRDADDAIEVVVVHKVGGRLLVPRWSSERAGEPVDLGPVIDSELARVVAKNTVRLPGWMGRASIADQLIGALEQYLVDSWQRSRWLAGALPLVLDTNRQARVVGFLFTYDPELGMTVEKEEKQ